MGMSTHIVGFRQADEQWKKMKAVWDACAAAGLRPPQEVVDFFDGENPKDKIGQEVDIGSAKKPWSNDYAAGFEIDIEKLPKGVKVIRFYNSW